MNYQSQNPMHSASFMADVAKTRPSADLTKDRKHRWRSEEEEEEESRLWQRLPRSRDPHRATSPSAGSADNEL